MRRTACSTLFPYTTLFRSVLGFDFRELLQRYVNRVVQRRRPACRRGANRAFQLLDLVGESELDLDAAVEVRSEEHTSELQSQSNLVCRLLLEKKKKKVHAV